MNNKKLVVLIATVILLLIILSQVIYYVFFKDFRIVKELNPINDNKDQEVQTEVKTPDEYWQQAEQENPDVLIGIISFNPQDTATLKTEDNKIYTFTPNQPEAVYGSFGVKDGDKVRVQAKILDENTIKWVKMEVVKN